MRISTFAAVTLMSCVGAAPSATRSTLTVDDLAAQGFSKLVNNTLTKGYPSAEICTLDNAAVRREWTALSSDQKKSYIAAVKCLSTKPGKTPAALAAGVKNRYDDFVAAHINQTLTIHGTGNFLPWHRYFIWIYEQELRNECGYTGYQPYFNWARYADNPAASPLFDGSDTSISGDGEYVAGRNGTCIPSTTSCEIIIPPAHGGGCIKAGPFKDWQVNLGPVDPSLVGLPTNPETSGLGYNPRCLRRDLNTASAQAGTTDSDVTNLIKTYTDYYTFSSAMQGNFSAGYLGVHTAGHYIIGGDPGGDVYASPGDPGFFFHHAMVDRTWWTWQNQDLATRQYAIGATITLDNLPPSRNATLNDTITAGYVGYPTITLRDAGHTLGGPFCYIYA